MFLKPGVETSGLHPEAWFALGAIEMAWRMLGIGEPTLTAGTDGEHKKGPLHNMGLGGDIRTRDVPMKSAAQALVLLRRHLDPLGFDTVLEDNHLHCEFDPKPGETWLKKGTL